MCLLCAILRDLVSFYLDNLKIHTDNVVYFEFIFLRNIVLHTLTDND